jgi:hypothetical protein
MRGLRTTAKNKPIELIKTRFLFMLRNKKFGENVKS